jgi:hypothetical protein
MPGQHPGLLYIVRIHQGRDVHAHQSYWKNRGEDIRQDPRSGLLTPTPEFFDLIHVFKTGGERLLDDKEYFIDRLISDCHGTIPPKRSSGLEKPG